MKFKHLLALCVLPCAVAAQQGERLPDLPASAATALDTSLERAAARTSHLWRDTPPRNDDRTVNAYVEIARGDRRKWEFDMRAHARKIDRVIPASIGGYPVNYGFVPQTVSYDGDPFDALVLGPPLPAGRLVRGVIVGIMHMEDEKGLDSKVVLSLTNRDGQPRHALTADVQHTIGEYFKKYKQNQPGLFSKVSGWGSAAEGLAWITTTHAFFRSCRNRANTPCHIEP